jgi:hypothetical protein
MDFTEFGKIARLSRNVTITEKIDGSNAQVAIFDPFEVGDNTNPGMFEVEYLGINYIMLAGSRKKWISSTDDNAGFAKWVMAHANELVTLGIGRHYGEWWGQGIQRGYGLKEKRFSLFNTYRWSDGAKDKDGNSLSPRPSCCHVVPVLYDGMFDTHVIQDVLNNLAMVGSAAAPGFMNPEGVVIYHSAGNLYFKKTIKNDEMPKSMVKEE